MPPEPRIRLAEPADAETLWRAEEVTGQTPGLLVGWPGEISVTAFQAKIATLARHGTR